MSATMIRRSEPVDAGVAPVAVRRWPSERPLYVLCLLVSLVLWVLLAVSVIGLIYGLMVAAFFFLTHLAFVAQVRGSSVRIGPDQFPELHARIEEIAQKLGMTHVPAAYLLQADGSLNAFATRFGRSHMIVLLSDLLDACGEDTAARDMIIGHELGHIHAGHLRLRWLTLPAMFIPFLGGALSRAREYTCDRYGLVAAGEQEGALLGLTILGAGPTHARRANRAAFVAQRAELNTGWMRIGEWLSTHPPLTRRIVALDPRFGTVTDGTRPASFRAAAALVTASIAMVGLSVVGAAMLPGIVTPAVDAAIVDDADDLDDPYVPPPFATAVAELERTVAVVAGFIAADVLAGAPLPADYAELESRWTAAHDGQPLPIDPFDGHGLGYNLSADGFVLWSTGADGRAHTHADIVRRFDHGARPLSAR